MGLRGSSREGAQDILSPDCLPGLASPPSVVLNQDIPHIFALTLFEDYVYWTDWETKSINRAHKTTGTNKTLLISTLHRPMDLHVFHALRQPDGKQPGVPAHPFSSIDQAMLARCWEVPEAVARPWSGSWELIPAWGQPWSLVAARP